MRTLGRILNRRPYLVTLKRLAFLLRRTGYSSLSTDLWRKLYTAPAHSCVMDFGHPLVVATEDLLLNPEAFFCCSNYAI